MSALLTRQTRVEIKESNIAVLDSLEFEANYRIKGDTRDPVWEGVGEARGVKIWRVEQSKLVDWPDLGPHVFRPQDRYGYFYDEDAYVVLYTYKKADSGKVPFSYDIHYWIGRNATQDDTATAAYKSVELDEHLGGQALVVQYREAQGHESQRFLALFPTFMVYRGGIRKIYRMWTTTHKIHKEFCQYNEKGKQTISYELSFDDLEIEQGGIYVYDSSDKLALFCTKASLAWERFWVGEMVMHIGYSRTGFSKNFAHFDEGTPGDTEFMALVGAKNVTPLHSRVYDHDVGPPAQLYRLSQTVPRMDCCPVKSPFTLDAFDSKDVYILDDYGNVHDPVVYVWVGKDVPDTKARIALVNGEVYLKAKKDNGRSQTSLSVTVVRIRQGQETPWFLKALGTEVKD